MATAPDMMQEAPQEADAPVDFEAEARKLGWVGVEDFKGDPKHHVDAETFYKRGQELMPLLKAQNKALLKRLDAAERTAKQAAEFFSKSEERAYQRALAEIRAEQEAAVESGDLAAHRAAADKLDKLEKPHKTDNDDPAQRAEEFADWGRENKWYATDTRMQNYADAQAALIAKAKGGAFLDKADLDAVTAKVREKFPEEFADDTKPSAKPRSPVEGVTASRAARGGRTYADLPPEAKAMADKWVKNGTIKSRDDFVKSFDFEGYAKAGAR